VRESIQMAGRHRGWEAVPLVGPGTELQLTLDGGAVPHVEVVAAFAQGFASRTMRSSSGVGEPRPSRFDVVTQREPSGAAAGLRTRP
jgi:hypothetical protein